MLYLRIWFYGTWFRPLPKTAHDCAVEATISVVSGKWKPILLYQMRDGAKRYSELHRLVPQASERMLVRSLRELEQDHLIQPKVYKQVPARVEYGLTADGESLISVLSMMSVWGNERKYAWDQSAQRQYWWMYFRVLISAEVPQKQLLLTSMSVTNICACSCFLWHGYVFCVVSEFREFESARCGGI